MMLGITDLAGYLPGFVLDVGAARGGRPGRTRSVASFDEDTTTMAVAATRRLPADTRAAARSLWFATSSPAYEARSNAVTVHLAAELPADIPAYDCGASVKSSFGAVRGAQALGGIAVIAEQWTGLPGSDDELRGADGSVAIAFGPEEQSIVTIEQMISRPLEVLDRWRLPSDGVTQVWDERFLAESLGEITEGLAAEPHLTDPAHVIVSSSNSRVSRGLGGLFGAEHTVESTNFGYAGAADAWFKLEQVLRTAQPGDRIVLVVVADGVEVISMRCTELLTEWQTARPEQQTEPTEVDYLSYLTWRGMLQTQPPRRPDPEPPAAPPALRSSGWKFALQGASCERCETLHTPPESTCRSCGGKTMTPMPLADRGGRVATMTIDRLAYSIAPPTVLAVVDLGGARNTFEVADGARERIAIGDEVDFSFRRLHSGGGIHDYFWKAVPKPAGTDRREDA